MCTLFVDLAYQLPKVAAMLSYFKVCNTCASMTCGQIKCDIVGRLSTYLSTVFVCNTCVSTTCGQIKCDQALICLLLSYVTHVGRLSGHIMFHDARAALMTYNKHASLALHESTSRCIYMMYINSLSILSVEFNYLHVSGSHRMPQAS